MSSATPEDLQAVMSRLAELQARLNSLEKEGPSTASGLAGRFDTELGRQMVESQNLRDTMKVFEQQQAQVFHDFVDGAGAFGEDIVKVLDRRLFPRLEAMFGGVKKAAQDRVAHLTPGAFEEKMDLQLDDLESRFEASIRQFSSVRVAFEQTEIKILEASDRMDAIWANQDLEGMGGWRTVMRSVSAYVGKHRDTGPNLSGFKAVGEHRGRLQPAILDLMCPGCGKEEVRRLYRKTIFEEALRLVAVAPYRCHACHTKFFRMGRG